MKKKVKFSEPRPGFLLLGLVSAEKGYRLCFQINNAGLLNLTKGEPVEVPVEDGGNMVFNRFESAGTDEDEPVYLVNNRQDGHILFPRFKNVDYIVVINGPDKKKKAAELKTGLISIPSIQAIFAMELEKLKSKNYLYLD